MLKDQSKIIIDAQIDQLKEKLKICEFLEEMESWIAEPKPDVLVDEDGIEYEEDNKQSSTVRALNQLVMTAWEFLLQGDKFEAEKYAHSYFKPPTPEAYKAKKEVKLPTPFI